MNIWRKILGNRTSLTLEDPDERQLEIQRQIDMGKKINTLTELVKTGVKTTVVDDNGESLMDYLASKGAQIMQAKRDS